MHSLPANILGQTRPLVLLSAYLANDTIPHALLFCGPDGVGKKTAARCFAMALNCANPPYKPGFANSAANFTGPAQTLCCGECRACRLIAANKHPDILYLRPEGALIKVEQVRGLMEALALKAVEATTRVIIIENAQQMNPAAANALLKTLEEPYPATVFILTAPTVTAIMPTILSRCQKVPFQPLTAATMQTLLKDEAPQIKDWEPIAYLSGGSLSMAKTLLTPEMTQRRLWLLNEMAALPKAAPARILSLAGELNKSKQHLAFDLNVILSWLRDCMALKSSGANIINRDFINELRYNANLYALKDLNARLMLLQSATAGLLQPNNTNPRLGLEHLLLALK